MAKKENNFLSQWRANFFTGLAILMPAVISIAVVVWLFRNVANLTDYLLFVFPRKWTHENGGSGELFWYSSVLAFVLAMLIIALVGRFG